MAKLQGSDQSQGQGKDKGSRCLEEGRRDDRSECYRERQPESWESNTSRAELTKTEEDVFVLATSVG